MTHKARLQVVKPLEVQMTLTITATIQTFVEVKEAMAAYRQTPGKGYGHGVSQFNGAICEAIDLAHANFVGIRSEGDPTDG